MFRFETWQEELNDEQSLRFYCELATFFAKKAASGAAIAHDISVGDFDSLLTRTVPFDLGAAEYYNCAQALGFLTKFPGLPVKQDPRENAIRKFIDGESKCRETNYLFSLWKRGEFQFTPAVESILHATQRKIQEIMGCCPHPSQVRFRFKVGGASTATKKKDADLRTLIEDSASCSEELLESPLLTEVLESVPLLASLHLGLSRPSEILDGGDLDGEVSLVLMRAVLDFVTKNAKTDRIITKEPPLNKFLQNGYGDHLRARCKRWGIDLRDQGINKERARQGSIDGSLATADLSNASGLIAFLLWEHLCPNDWWEVLTAIRCAHTEYQGYSFHLQSYAGMGNGTTFPVESILFHCLTSAVCEYYGFRSDVTVYGDDIILPSEAYPKFREVFEVLGFEVNDGKTFAAGPFRESCGADWYLGEDVRPFMAKDNVSCRLLFNMHNFFTRRGDEVTANYILSRIPEHYRIFGPDGYGDGHLLGPWGENGTYNRETDQWTFETFAPVGKRDFSLSRGEYILPAYTVYANHPPSPRGDVVPDFRNSRKDWYTYPRLKTEGWLSHLLRAYALSFEERALPTDEQTAKQRGRRGWKIRVRKGVEVPPDAMLPVKGFDRPGVSSYKRISLCTFSRP